MYESHTITIREVENGWSVRFHDPCGFGKEFVQHDLGAVFELIREFLEGDGSDR